MVPLPAPPESHRSGVFVFVFTDITDSTKLTSTVANGIWRPIKERHDSLTLQSAQDNGSIWSKSTGDGFLIVFRDPSAALKLAIELQRLMRAEEWPDGVSLCIKIGIHIGNGEFSSTSNDFDGDAVNRAARVVNNARPEEILLSATFHQHVKDLENLGFEVRFENAGNVRFKGIATRQDLFRVLAPGLPSDFAPLGRRGNLAAHRRKVRLFGRERVISEVRQAVHGSSKLISLWGTIGVGKSEVAAAAAAAAQDAFEDGAWIFHLASQNAATDGFQLVAQEMVPGAAPSVSALDVLVELLRDRSCLLLLTSCDRILAKDPQCFRDGLTRLVQDCPGMRILVTSLSAIDIQDGSAIHIKPLPVPDEEECADREALSRCPSVALFCDAVRRRRPDFELIDENTEPVGRICRALEGIPLFLNIAGGLIGRRNLRQLAEDTVSHVFNAPASGDSSEQVFDWACETLLSEAGFLRALGVFAGGFYAEDAQFVCDKEDVLKLLDKLVQMSLVQNDVFEDPGAAEPRYRLTRALAHYCRKKLGTNRNELERRHAERYLAILEAESERLRTVEQASAMRRLSLELENLLAAAEHALNWVDLDWLARFLHVSYKFLSRRGLWTVAESIALRCHHLAQQAPDSAPRKEEALAGATSILGAVSLDQGRHPEAEEWLREALTLWSKLDEPVGTARVYDCLGTLVYRRGDFGLALTYFEKGHEAAVRCGRFDLEARSTLGQARVLAAEERRELRDEGDSFDGESNADPETKEENEAADALETKLQETLRLCEKAGDTWDQAMVYGVMANHAFRRRDWSRAQAYYQEDLDICRRLDDPKGTVIAQTHLGAIAAERREIDRAFELLEAAWNGNRTMGDRFGMAIVASRLSRALYLGERIDLSFLVSLAACEEMSHQGVLDGEEGRNAQELANRAREALAQGRSNLVDLEARAKLRKLEKVIDSVLEEVRS